MNADSKVNPGGRVAPRDARQARFALSFAQIIAVLMRDQSLKNLRIADLEWLVLPPVMAGQWRFAQSPVQSPAAQPGQETQGGMLVPVAVALWARVSPEIDKRLSENANQPTMLKPNEWVSGDNLWMIATAGEPRVVPTFLKKLAETEFQGKTVKIRVPDGKNGFAIKTLADLVPAQ